MYVQHLLVNSIDFIKYLILDLKKKKIDLTGSIEVSESLGNSTRTELK